jgi:hypothetical protein
VTDVPQWRLEDDWFDVCKCTIPCSCTFAQAPSEGDCQGILAWHIREGRYTDVELDGLNVLAYWAAEVPGKATARAEALTGPTTAAGQRVQVHNAPGAEVGPGQVATWGTATVDRADGFGFSWDWEGRSSKHFPFDWSGP